MKKRLTFLCALMAVLTPAFSGEAPLRAQAVDVNTSSAPERQKPDLRLDQVATPPFRVLEQSRQPDTVQQVRIQQRVIIRVSPSPPDARERMLSLLPRRATRNSFEEVAHADCVELESIVGVQPTADNRLLLFLENRQVLAASLEGSCTARAFYSGFYVEQNDDGRLCIARDRLQSRAGVSCGMEQLTRLVAVGS